VFNRILVALDSSEQSNYVIDCVLQIKLQPSTSVILCHVIELSETNLEQPANLPCESSLEIVMGDPTEEIIRLSNIYQADLIVLGSRGLTGVNRILKGSVSSQVVSEATCPVLVVKF
jgi:nucleotide-binding universal stress UspA family protein